MTPATSTALDAPALQAWLASAGLAGPHQAAAHGNTPLMHAASIGMAANLDCQRLLRADARQTSSATA